MVCAPRRGNDLRVLDWSIKCSYKPPCIVLLYHFRHVLNEYGVEECTGIIYIGIHVKNNNTFARECST